MMIMTNKLLALGIGAFLLMPLGALAHQTTMYEINGVEYEFVVGSLGEPVIVDDRTGVDFELVRDGELVAGANEMLRVEMKAAGQSRESEFSPVYGAEGRYKTDFIATVATTLEYRIFGELEGTPIDLTFTCNPAGHPQVEENTERIDVAPGIVQTLQRGSFSCPQEKAAFGFPEEAPDLVGLEGTIGDIEDRVEANASYVKESRNIGTVFALVIALVALGYAHAIARRQKKSPEA